MHVSLDHAGESHPVRHGVARVINGGTVCQSHASYTCIHARELTLCHCDEELALLTMTRLPILISGHYLLSGETFA